MTLSCSKLKRNDSLLLFLLQSGSTRFTDLFTRPRKDFLFSGGKRSRKKNPFLSRQRNVRTTVFLPSFLRSWQIKKTVSISLMPLSPIPPVTSQTSFPPLLFPSLATLLYLFSNILAVFSLHFSFLSPLSFFSFTSPNFGSQPRFGSVRVRGSVPAIWSEILARFPARSIHRKEPQSG